MFLERFVQKRRVNLSARTVTRRIGRELSDDAKEILLDSVNSFQYHYVALDESTDVRSSHPEVFLVKGVLKICSKFTGEHPCRNVISIKLQSKETAKEHVKEIGNKHPSWHLNIQS